MICKIPEFFWLAGCKSGQPTSFKEKIIAGTKIHQLKLDKGKEYIEFKEIVLAYAPPDKPFDIIVEIFIVSTQEVEFIYSDRNTPDVFIDGRRAGILEIFALAANEGFATEALFFQVYNKSKKYKLVHWTEYRYDGNPARLQAVNDHHLAVNKMNQF